MALTRDFSETVQARARRDPGFRECLLKEGIMCLLAGEGVEARIILRDYIISDVGFEQLGAITGNAPEKLTRMLDPEGALHAGELLEVVACILRHEGLALQVSTVPAERLVDDRAAVESAAVR